MPKPSGRFLAAALVAMAFIAGAVVVRWPYDRTLSAPAIKMLFTYPVTYLEPTLYDDWETVFIGNHIYPRLLPEKDKPEIPFLTPEVSLSCADPAGLDVQSSCRRVKVIFSPRPFSDCLGRAYRVEDLRREFEALLKAKTWALPKWERCPAAADQVCVIGNNTGDVERRLRNVNFRFGWAKRRASDRLFGAGPYCLSARFGSKKEIGYGALLPRDRKMIELPRIDFIVGEGKNADFNVALYGTRDLLKGARRNVQAHTPLAYYVVTNPALAGRRLPWNDERTRQAIRSHFIKTDVFFPETSGLEKLVPPGAALEPMNGEPAPREPLELALPDYLPGCADLAAELTAAWSARGGRAVCTNIVTFIQRRVREKAGRWSGFLVGVSPSDPGREALKVQYFSKDSPDSLTYESSDPERSFYLAGIGQSHVTVDGQRVCDLRPSVLGLGDIFVTDFLPCDR